MIFSVSGNIDLLSLVIGALLISALFNMAISDPFETLSPTLTFKLEIFPSKGDGTSTLDLSLSNVSMGSFFLI